MYRPSTGQWLIRNQVTVQFGDDGDRPVPADYNRDGVVDVAVYRPSTGMWFVRNQFAVQFGDAADIPVPGDYNGDARADIAVYRPSTGTWYVRNLLAVQFGDAGRHPRAGQTTTATASPTSRCIDRQRAYGTSVTCSRRSSAIPATCPFPATTTATERRTSRCSGRRRRRGWCATCSTCRSEALTTSSCRRLRRRRRNGSGRLSHVHRNVAHQKPVLAAIRRRRRRAARSTARHILRFNRWHRLRVRCRIVAWPGLSRLAILLHSPGCKLGRSLYTRQASQLHFQPRRGTTPCPRTVSRAGYPSARSSQGRLASTFRALTPLTRSSRTTRWRPRRRSPAVRRVCRTCPRQRISTTTGSRCRARSTSGSIWPSPARWTALFQLLDGSGNSVGSGSGGGPGVDERIDITLAAGVYYIRVF